MSVSKPMIHVLIADDSSFMRKALTRLINEGMGLEVIGTADDGEQALTAIAKLRPDVIVLDLEMPKMTGLQALKVIMERHPLPVVIFSSQTKSGADVTLKCLELGAIDFICKPSGISTADLASIRYIIWQKIRAAAHAQVSPGFPAVAHQPEAVRPVDDLPHPLARKVVAIGASTGGPRALMEVLEALPASLAAGVLVTQHMPPPFTAAMAQRLDAHCALMVREAQEDDTITNGKVLIAPGGKHLRINANGRITLSDAPPLWGVRPAVDPMMEDCAQHFGSACLGVILTGMGHDGTAGLARIHHEGGQTIAQDEPTSVVYGMPRSAVEAGIIDQILPLSSIAGSIRTWCASARQGRIK